MDTSCPFMALQSALDKSKVNGSANPSNRGLNLSCPFSGKQMSPSHGEMNDNIRQPTHFDDETKQDHRISQWMRQVPRSASPLGAISEDIESKGVDDNEQKSMHSGYSGHGRQSFTGSIHSGHSILSGLQDPSSRYGASVILVIMFTDDHNKQYLGRIHFSHPSDY